MPLGPSIVPASCFDLPSVERGVYTPDWALIASARYYGRWSMMRLMSVCARSGYAAVDDLRCSRLLHKTLGVQARLPSVDEATHQELGPHNVQPLADALADAARCTTALLPRAGSWRRAREANAFQSNAPLIKPN
jgi:hypothetical protein